MSKLLPWGVGAALVLGLLFSTRSAAGAEAGPSTAPASVMTALGKATYEESASKKDVHTVFAQVLADPIADPYTAKAWVRAEQTSGRVVFSTTSVLEELELSSAPLYSFPTDKIPAYIQKSSTFYRLPEA